MITAIVLTKNESLHIRRCLENLKKINAKVKLVDSGSTDQTIQIAKEFDNVEIYSREWVNYADQFNWAIDNCGINTEWIIRIDADEYLEDELIRFINYDLVELPQGVNGVYVRRAYYFLGKKIKYGDGKVYHLKIWRNGAAYCEIKWMDEHMIMRAGNTIMIEGELTDHNLSSITEFLSKHNSYASREAIDYFAKYGAKKSMVQNDNDNAPTYGVKKIYYKFPIFIRPILFFIYTLFIRRGIFDGVEGILYHALQKLFYRFTVDVKIFEALRREKFENADPIVYLKSNI